MKTTTSVRVILPPPWVPLLEAAAARQGCSVAHLVREAIRERHGLPDITVRAGRRIDATARS